MRARARQDWKTQGGTVSLHIFIFFSLRSIPLLAQATLESTVCPLGTVDMYSREERVPCRCNVSNNS